MRRLTCCTRKTAYKTFPGEVHTDDTISTTSLLYEASETSLEGKLFVSSQHRTGYERDVPLYTKHTLLVTLKKVLDDFTP